jgi:Protein of unknown function (DUF2530)
VTDAVSNDDSNASRQVKPLDLDAVRTVQVGTIAWAIALIVLLPFHSRLAAADHTWWLWTCVVGLLLGFAGVAFTTNRRRKIQARSSRTS